MPSSSASASADAVAAVAAARGVTAGVVFALTLYCHCLGHRGGRGELLRDGEGEEGCCERGGVGAHAEGVEQEEGDGGRVRDLQGHDRERHCGGERQGGEHHGGGDGRGGRGEDARRGARMVLVLARAGEVRAELAGEGVDVDRDEGEGHGGACEGRVVDGEEVRGEDGGGAIEDGEVVHFREVVRARGRGVCDVQCVA